MQHGFIQIAAAVPELQLADPQHNARNLCALIRQAAQQGVKVLVFPELCLTGYSCGDLLMQHTLLEGAKQALLQVTQATAGLDLLCFVGLALEVDGAVYDVACALYDGQILGITPKTALSDAGEHAESRWFHPAPETVREIALLGQRVPFGPGLVYTHENCADLTVGAELGLDLDCPVQPSTALALAGATVICNLSASAQIVGRGELRRVLCQAQSARLRCAYVLSGAGEGESSQDLVFTGHSLIYENGALLAEMEKKSGLLITQIDVQRLAFDRRRCGSFGAGAEAMRIAWGGACGETALTRHISKSPFVPENAQERAARCRMILDLQAAGLARRVAHTGAKTLIVGVSGGLDSTLAMLVAARALDQLGRSRADLLAVTMPCFGTTARTRSNAQLLAEQLGARLQCVDIRASVEQHFRDIGHDPAVTDVTYENAQARERTQVLMDLANEHGGLVVGTGDLSELALGWATYNGDHMSMYGVNAGVPKTLIRHVVAFCADTCGDAALAAVLRDVLATPVSPELLPPSNGRIAQKTEDLVGPYELHDFYLYYLLRWGFDPAKLYRLAQAAFAGAYDNETLLHWLKTLLRRFFSQQFKRSCLPDGPKIGSVGLSPRGDWHMPSDACRELWLRQAEALKP